MMEKRCKRNPASEPPSVPASVPDVFVRLYVLASEVAGDGGAD